MRDAWIELENGVTMDSPKRLIAILLEFLAVILLIGTAVIFAAAQRVDPSRVDD